MPVHIAGQRTSSHANLSGGAPTLPVCGAAAHPFTATGLPRHNNENAKYSGDVFEQYDMKLGRTSKNMLPTQADAHRRQRRNTSFWPLRKVFSPGKVRWPLWSSDAQARFAGSSLCCTICGALADSCVLDLITSHLEQGFRRAARKQPVKANVGKVLSFQVVTVVRSCALPPPPHNSRSHVRKPCAACLATLDGTVAVSSTPR